MSRLRPKLQLGSIAVFAAFTVGGCRHPITATAGTGGTITPSGTIRVAHRADQTFTIAAATGQALADVLVDGTATPLGGAPAYTFHQVVASHTIAVSFVPDASHYRLFDAIYATAGTKLDGACVVCHQPHGGGTTPPMDNPYGRDIHAKTAAGYTKYQALRAIEGDDSDGDGFANLAEIQARTFPGDPADHP